MTQCKNIDYIRSKRRNIIDSLDSIDSLGSGRYNFKSSQDIFYWINSIKETYYIYLKSIL